MSASIFQPIVEHELNIDDKLSTSIICPDSDYTDEKSHLFKAICHNAAGKDKHVEWRSILESCGQNINHIYDGGYCMTAEIFSLAQRFCPQLKTINISLTHANLQHVKFYLPQWKTLEEIELRGPAPLEEVLQSLRELPNLRKLSLWDFDMTISECMPLNFISQITHFEISSVEPGFPAKISGLLTNLVSLHVYTMPDKRTLIELAKYCIKLENLYLFDGQEYVLGNIGYFYNLKSLEIHDQFANAFFLLNSLDQRYDNHLQKLIIPGKSIYQKEARNIAKLSALKSLSCVIPDILCLKYLLHLELEHLSLYSCGNLRNTMLLIILQDFKTLRSLEITLCDKINFNVIKDALKILHLNGVKPQKPFELKLIGSSIKPDMKQMLSLYQYSNLLHLTLG